MDSAHRLEHKSTLYEEACRIPLVIRPPGGIKGRVDNVHLISNGLDLMPTFCDWAGVAPPAGLPGRSLRELTEHGGTHSWREEVPVECVIGRAVVTDRFKYCLYDIGANREQLLDLESDPWECENAIDNPVHRQTVESLRASFLKTFGGEQRQAPDVLKAAADA
jgi:arylsulfatase A-like enzyme